MSIFWNTNLVILSILTAMYGSFSALSHAERMRTSVGTAATSWMLAGGVTLGVSIWAMHFIGMLAFHLPVPISYDLTLTVISVLPAVGAALLGFYLLRMPAMKFSRLVLGGLMMGVGISSMHYTGMAALKMQPSVTYELPAFIASILISVVASIGALLIVYAGEKSKLNPFVRHAVGALIMGLAIAGMHYTGMVAANFATGSICTVEGNSINPTLLALFISGVVFFLVTGGWIANFLDRRMMRQNARALYELGMQTKELEIDRDILEKVNSGKPPYIVLNNLVELVETQHPEMLCAVLLLADDGKHFVCQAAPNLPELYREVTNGCEIAEGVGSCGTAAIKGELVIVEDIKKHPFWVAYQEFANQCDIRSCWSQPIKNYENRVLGVFAIYHRTPSKPSQYELNLLERYAHLAQLVLASKEHEDEISHMAYHDTLTQLPNRRLLIDRLQHAIDVSDRTGRYGAVMYIDLDNFKTLNDIKGHEFGDQVLCEVANRLNKLMRRGDTVARLGGDEFVIMLADVDDDKNKAIMNVEIVAEKVLNVLKQPYILTDYEHHGSASIGISIFKGCDTSVANLMKHADTAMYQSKHAGKNNLHFFDPVMQETIENKLSMQNDLRDALLNHQLQLYYQLQTNDSNQIIGAEALIRWQHPKRGFIPPIEFIRVAEESGIILDIGIFVLRTACEQLKKWEYDTKTKDLVLAVNVSVLQLKQHDFVDVVKRILNETEANPTKLKIEITESMVVENVNTIVEKMLELRAIGVRFSMDDFGTGYSSLAAIKNLPITQLKIDKSFVDDIANNSNGAAIVKTIIAMGHTLGLNVIAEGVETTEQLALLKQYECPFFQGYLFSRPLPIDDFQTLISGWDTRNTWQEAQLKAVGLR